MIPLLLDLHERKTVIIGGGKIATRKVLHLYKETNLTLVSPDITDEISALAKAQKIIYQAKKYSSDDLVGADFVIIATNDRQLNAQIAKDCRPGQWVDNTSDKTNSNFYSMAEIREENFTIAISSDGKAPLKTRQLKERLASFLRKNK